MPPAYPGPLREEPLAIELHNTLYAVRGELVDGLADARGLRAWLAGLADRLPAEARAADPARLDDFLALRAAIRDALQAAGENRRVPVAAVRAINAASRRSPRSPRLVQPRDRHAEPGVDFHGADATGVALGAFAADAIDLLTGPRGADLRRCLAPGCVLVFLEDHPRRAWCSKTCGNRARQARHYARTRRAC